MSTQRQKGAPNSTRQKEGALRESGKRKAEGVKRKEREMIEFGKQRKREAFKQRNGRWRTEGKARRKKEMVTF